MKTDDKLAQLFRGVQEQYRNLKMIEKATKEAEEALWKTNSEKHHQEVQRLLEIASKNLAEVFAVPDILADVNRNAESDCKIKTPGCCGSFCYGTRFFILFEDPKKNDRGDPASFVAIMDKDICVRHRMEQVEIEPEEGGLKISDVQAKHFVLQEFGIQEFERNFTPQNVHLFIVEIKDQQPWGIFFQILEEFNGVNTVVLDFLRSIANDPNELVACIARATA